MPDEIRVLIVDDHLLFRRGVADILREQEGYRLAGEAENGEEGVRLCLQLNPDVVLMDVHMPGMSGVKAMKEIKGKSATPVLMLTVSEKDEDLVHAIEAGADGYLLKNIEPDELIRAIKLATEGHAVLAPEVTDRVMRKVQRRKEAPKTELSLREEEVLAILSQGATNQEIAKKLVISENTVKTHVNKIYKKLGVSNRAEAVAKALSLGLIQFEAK